MPGSAPSLYKNLVRPHLFQGEAEAMHNLGHRMLGLLQSFPYLRTCVEKKLTISSPVLEQAWANLHFKNPIGLAAGFDKGGKNLHAFQALGFGFIEMGTVTRYAQPGNPAPRLFRLREDQGIINRMGFNGEGADVVAARLERTSRLSCPLFINVGLSKRIDATDAKAVEEEYAYIIRVLYEYGDAFTVNVSSPNTPGLRSLQRREPLKALLSFIVQLIPSIARERGLLIKPLFFKIAPDLNDEELNDVIEVYKEIQNAELPIGIIATNTTLARENLRSPLRDEKGGLSGQPLTRRAQEVATTIRRELPEVFLIGVGGIQTAEQAIERLTVANLIQIYSGLVYEGPTLIKHLNRGIQAEVDRLQLKNVAELSRKRP